MTFSASVSTLSILITISCGVRLRDCWTRRGPALLENQVTSSQDLTDVGSKGCSASVSAIRTSDEGMSQEIEELERAVRPTNQAYEQRVTSSQELADVGTKKCSASASASAIRTSDEDMSQEIEEAERARAEHLAARKEQLQALSIQPMD